MLPSRKQSSPNHSSHRTSSTGTGTAIEIKGTTGTDKTDQPLFRISCRLPLKIYSPFFQSRLLCKLSQIPFVARMGV